MKNIILTVTALINIIACSPEHRELDQVNQSAMNFSKDLTVGCQIHFLGSPFNCPYAEFDLVAPSRTQSNIQFFNKISGETRLTYTFQCQFNGPAPKAQFLDQTKNISFVAAPTNDLRLQTLVFKKDPQTPIKVKVDFEPLTFLTGTCQFDVMSMIDVPSVDLLELYGSFLVELTEMTHETIHAFDQEAALPAKFQIIEDLPRQLESKVRSEVRQCQSYVRKIKELGDYQTKSDENEREKIKKILGTSVNDSSIDWDKICPAISAPDVDICRDFSPQLADDGELGQTIVRMKELDCLARDIREGLPAINECENSDLRCLTKLEAVKNRIQSKKSNEIEKKTADLIDFIGKEIKRISEYSQDLTQGLSNLIQKMKRG
jgi:hypothetical protein